jgi:GT2 family glycosyltransferase
VKDGMAAGLLLNYRDAARSEHCIRSLLAQGIEHVLVWDNSSDDGESAAQLLKSLSGDTRVVVKISRDNLGFAKGINEGLRACIECFDPARVLVINNDAILLPGAWETLRSEADVHSRAALISMDIDHAGKRHGPMFYQRWSGLQFPHAVVGAFPYASGCCLLVDMARAPVPLFDEAFFMYGEDCELGWRLAQHPGEWVHVPQILVRHEGSASSGLGSPFYETSMVAAHLLLARKLARGRGQALFFLLARVLVLFARALRRGLRYRSWIPLRALWNGARLAWLR